MGEIGTRRLLIGGVLLVAVSSVLFGFLHYVPSGAPFIALALCLRLAEGVGAAGLFTTSLVVQALAFPDHVAFTFGMRQTAIAIGFTIGPAIGGGLYSLGGFGLPFWALGGLLLLLTAGVYPIFSKVDVPTATSASDKRRPSYGAAVDVGLQLLTLFSGAVATGFFDSVIALHVAPLLNGAFQVALVILLAGASDAIAAPIAGLLVDRRLMSTTLALALGFLAVVVGFALMGPTPLVPSLKKSLPARQLPIIIVGVVAYGLSMGVFFSVTFKAAVDAAIAAGAPSDESTFGILSAMFNISFNVGAMIGPILGGALQDTIGFPLSSTLVAAVELVIGLVVCGKMACVTYRKRVKSKRFDLTLEQNSM